MVDMTPATRFGLPSDHATELHQGLRPRPYHHTPASEPHLLSNAPRRQFRCCYRADPACCRAVAFSRISPSSALVAAMLTCCHHLFATFLSYSTVPAAHDVLVPETLLKKRKSDAKAREEKAAKAAETKKVSIFHYHVQRRRSQEVSSRRIQSGKVACVLPRWDRWPRRHHCSRSWNLQLERRSRSTQ